MPCKVSDKLSKKFPGGATAVKMGIPFCAVVAAGTASLLIVRQGEFKNGVAVKVGGWWVVGGGW